MDIFLDSGAYSAWTQKVKIDIQEYIDFIKKYEKSLSAYAVLDVIGDPVATLKNQKIMEKAGLMPVPCFHHNEPLSYLEDYVANYDYIALGGLVGKSGENLKSWLDRCFEIICDDKGEAKTKVHGFGLTTVKMMLRYPWYSVDSTSWVMVSRFGGVFVPVYDAHKKDYNYTEIPWKIKVSDKSPDKTEKSMHYDTLPASTRKHIDAYFKMKGYTVEELAKEYMKRDELNIIYFMDFEKNYKPQPFKVKKSEGFF